ncbi:MarR family winged helix-turn-helix transcriptional regulator [Streptomyces sp. Ru73]|uniref:MarR family winged helix-turn-helix transcriptional regulator n=1 Tax=Streptomyces sp. Ru73 TaxID=2080748 RepID=UPI0015E44BFA|nr:MarR family transcriptional regulator [Streptomyces sp. Ru73]
MGIDECIVFTLGKAYQQVHGELKRRLKALGLTVPQYSVLAGLWERDGRTAGQLCERLVMDSATITGVLDRLERAGLVTRAPDEKDRRLVRLRLTAAGVALRDEVQRTVADLNEEILRSFPADEAERLYAGLRVIAKGER